MHVLLGKKVTELALSMRTENVLARAGINYVWQLMQCTERDLLRLCNSGRKTVEEIKIMLRDSGGFYLGSDPWIPSCKGKLNDHGIWDGPTELVWPEMLSDAAFVSGDYT